MKIKSIFKNNGSETFIPIAAYNSDGSLLVNGKYSGNASVVNGRYVYSYDDYYTSLCEEVSIPGGGQNDVFYCTTSNSYSIGSVTLYYQYGDDIYEVTV